MPDDRDREGVGPHRKLEVEAAPLASWLLPRSDRSSQCPSLEIQAASFPWRQSPGESDLLVNPASDLFAPGNRRKRVPLRVCISSSPGYRSELQTAPQAGDCCEVERGSVEL